MLAIPELQAVKENAIWHSPIRITVQVPTKVSICFVLIKKKMKYGKSCENGALGEI